MFQVRLCLTQDYIQFRSPNSEKHLYVLWFFPFLQGIHLLFDLV